MSGACGAPRRISAQAASAALPPGARIVTEPPAFSTAATADFEAPQTENVSLALSSPLPSSRTPSLGAAQDAGLDQRRGVDRCAGVELAGVDRLLHAAEIDLVELERETAC